MARAEGDEEWRLVFAPSQRGWFSRSNDIDERDGHLSGSVVGDLLADLLLNETTKDRADSISGESRAYSGEGEVQVGSNILTRSVSEEELHLVGVSPIHPRSRFGLGSKRQRNSRIPMVRIRLLLAILLAVIFELSAPAVEQSDAKQPNIILVMADDQGWGDVGYNGHPFVKTPELDAMARDGFVFDRFYAAAPVCSPTRASVMTGRNPIRTKVTNHGRYMRPHEQTIAESLKAAGYVTGIFGKVHLGSGQPDSPCNPTGMGFNEWVVGLNFYDNDPYLSRNGKIEHCKGKGSVIAMDDAIAFLNKQHERDQPMFAVIWFPSPHDPHQEVPDGPSLYDGEKMAGYYREITLLDQQLGRLRRELRSMEIADNTILWYCSDNGGLVEATSGGRKRKGSIYEGGLRIPAIIEWPARSMKGRTAVPAWTCDIYPTLLAMAGIDSVAPHQLDGIDISQIIAGKTSKRSKPMGFWHNFQPGQATWSDRIQKAIMQQQLAGASLPHNARRMRKDVDEFPQFSEEVAPGHAAWNDWPWKLHRINGTKYELYNLADDPMETTDRSADSDQQKRLKQMRGDLNGWMRSVVGSINGKDYNTVAK